MHFTLATLLSCSIVSAQPRSRSLTDPAECNSRQSRSVHNWANRDVDVAVAVCASGGAVGSAKYLAFWRDISQGCASGSEPVKLWEQIENVPFLSSNGFTRLWCDDVFKLMKRLDMPVDVKQAEKDLGVAESRKLQAQQQLRRNAAGGSAAARFLLASSLLDIENANSYRGPTTREGLQLLENMAMSGYTNEVFRFVTDLQQRYPASSSTDLRYGLYQQIFGALARAGDPRGFVRLAEEKLRLAVWDQNHGNRPAMLSNVAVAKRYLGNARSKASGDLLSYIDKLDQQARQIENSPTSAHVLAGLLLSGASFVGTWQSAGLETAVKRVEDCKQSKPSVDIDPTLRLTYALFGCYPY